MVQLNFDATNVAPASAPVPLETGWYPANILLTEMKPTKNGAGNYLEVTFRLSQAPHAGRTLKSRLNLQNTNQQAVDIAYAELSAICHAVGKLRVAQSQELHGGPLEIYVKKVPRDDKPSELSNDVAGYRAVGAVGSQPGHAGAVGTQVASAPAWGVAPAAVTPPAPVAATPSWAPPAAAVEQPANTFAPPPTASAPVAPAGANATPPWAR